MKTKLYILTLFSLALIYSCKHPETSDTCQNCQNGSYCYKDTCRCLTGYEGANCETKTALKFLGDYTVSDSGSFSWTSCVADPKYQTVVITRTHLSSIYEGNNIGEIIISNYFGDGAPAIATVKDGGLIIKSGLKISYGSPIKYTTDVCFLNEHTWPTGVLSTVTDSAGTNTVITVEMHGYCFIDKGTCGNEVKETICKSIFTKN